MNLSHALRRGVDQEKSFREAVRRARVPLLSSEARGTVTGDDAISWITAMVLAVTGLASVTVHAMTGGSVAAGFRREIAFRSVTAKIARTHLT